MLHNIIFLKPSIFFYISCDFVIITVTMFYDVTDMWQCNPHHSNPNSKFKNRKINEKRVKEKVLNEKASIQALYFWHTSAIPPSTKNIEMVTKKDTKPSNIKKSYAQIFKMNILLNIKDILQIKEAFSALSADEVGRIMKAKNSSKGIKNPKST